MTASLGSVAVGSAFGSMRRRALEALCSPRASWRAPALGAMLAAVCAALWQTLWPPTYSATSRIVVDASAADASASAAEWIATQADIIRSQRVARRVAADVGLAASAGHSALAEVDESADRLLAHLAVEPSSRGAVIAVRYASSDPVLAAQVADAFVAAYERVGQEIQAATVAAIKERARASLSALRNDVEQAQIRLAALDRADGQGAMPDLSQAVRVAALANWSGLPGAHDSRSASVLADTDPPALNGASLERPAPSLGALQDARSDLEQARQALVASQARLAQFDSDRMLSRPLVTLLNGARESVSAPRASVRDIVALAALCGLIAAWALRAIVRRVDRRVVDADDLVRFAGLTVLGVLQSSDARSIRAVRQPPRRSFAGRGDAVPALP